MRLVCITKKNKWIEVPIQYLLGFLAGIGLGIVANKEDKDDKENN